jgi:ribosomal protein L11 methyltransferase
MKPRPLWRVSAVTTPEADDAIADLFQSVLGEPASSYTRAETNDTIVTVYLRQKPRWQAARRALLAGLARIGDCGLRIGAGRISLRRVRPQDWAESWKRHFKPLEIGSGLLLRPSWSRRRGRPGRAVVTLDPGLSFGTGRHPTTAFCLRQVARLRKRFASPSLLDIGTGSGILAIAAAKLGYAPVHAFDFDPDAVRVARANARHNRVLDRVRITRADVTRLPMRSSRRYDVVCANLISNLLMAERERIVARLRPGGVLLLAGILKEEFPAVQRAFEAAGLKRIASRAENEWRSGAFKRK